MTRRWCARLYGMPIVVTGTQANFIDRTDFLNIAVREKKKFETALDDSVASGLNTGVHLLMSQADHLLSSLQDPADYCPAAEGYDFTEGPTKACTAVIECLRKHCDLLKGSTDKQILEVFYCEIGIRLHACVRSGSFEVPLSTVADSSSSTLKGRSSVPRAPCRSSAT
jgi:hypothetical protein